MKKSVIVLIFLVYLASIVFINIFGMKILAYDTEVYATGIECINDDMILTECTSCESGAISVGNEVSVSMDTVSSEEVPILNVGDTIRVVYIG